MNENLYSAIISHANTNVKTVGKQLFNALSNIDESIFEQSECNNVCKHAYIESLNKTKESILLIYAKKNKLI